jgi:hypothetical protein
MTIKPHIVPKIVIRSIAIGLLLMAFFTMMWTGIAESGFEGRDHGIAAMVFIFFSLLFIIYAIYLFVISKRFPELSNEQKPEGKKLTKWYGIIFGSEGAIIGITCGILFGLHYQAFIIPAIALIVGLHFYPMATIFKRKIDYYLASWVCIVAITGIVVLINKSISESDLFAFTGVGVALATTGYGIYMLVAGSRYAKQVAGDIIVRNT